MTTIDRLWSYPERSERIAFFSSFRTTIIKKPKQSYWFKLLITTKTFFYH